MTSYERYIDTHKAYYTANKDRIRRDHKAYYVINCERIKQKSRDYHHSQMTGGQKTEFQLKRRLKSYRINDEKRTRVLAHYSKGTMSCRCCGEASLEFLTIDHLKARSEYGHPKKLSGAGLYHWIILNKFPEGFEVLCFNCNCSLGFRGYCPHHPEIKRPFTRGKYRML